jgi:hypothetical protein
MRGSSGVSSMKLIAAAWMAALIFVQSIHSAHASSRERPFVRMARYGVQQGAQAADALLWSQVQYTVCMFVQHRACLEVLVIYWLLYLCRRSCSSCSSEASV